VPGQVEEGSFRNEESENRPAGSHRVGERRDRPWRWRGASPGNTQPVCRTKKDHRGITFSVERSNSLAAPEPATGGALEGSAPNCPRTHTTLNGISGGPLWAGGGGEDRTQSARATEGAWKRGRADQVRGGKLLGSTVRDGLVGTRRNSTVIKKVFRWSQERKQRSKWAKKMSLSTQRVRVKR